MRALFSDTNPAAGHRRRGLLFGALLLAALCLLAVTFDAGQAPAKTLQEKRDATQSKLNGVRENQSAVENQLAVENREIDAMIGEVSALRQKQAAVEAELEEKEAELVAATKALREEREHLVEVRHQLTRALAALRDRLVSIYEAGSPDIVNTILESENLAQLEAQTEYLNRIQSYDNSVVGRVKALRNEVTGAVQHLTKTRDQIEEARNSIAAIEQEVAAAKAAAEARFGELKSAQSERRATMESLESKGQALSDNLSSISEQIAAQAQARAAAGSSPNRSAKCRRR
jgi:peptidoglycan hydrolase CwlO-like protein